MKDIFKEIDRVDPAELERHGIIQPARTRANGYSTYICPFCGNGSGKSGDGLTVKGYCWGFNYCCHGRCGGENYTATKLIAEHLNVSNDSFEVVKWAKEHLNLSDDSDFSFSKKKTEGTGDAMNEQEQQNFKIELEQWNKNLKEFVDVQGGKWRGLTFETLNYFGCGYCHEWKHPTKPQAPPTQRVIIPTNDFEYLARRIDDKKEYAKQQAGGVKTPFNLDRINAETPIFIVEGEIDCMSIWQATHGDFQAVAIRAASNIKNFMNAVNAKFFSSTEKPKFIILFDKDSESETGQKDADTLKKKLNDAGYLATIKFFDKFDFDSNDCLIQLGKKKFIDIFMKFFNDSAVEFEEIENQPATTTDNTPQQPKFDLGVSLADFARNKFKKIQEQIKKYSARRTGFSNIDENQIFLPGLYVVGGIPSSGKTAFVWQMSEQLAENGELVFYFSYEVPEYQLLSRTLSRNTFQADEVSRLSSADIQTGGTSRNLEKYFAELVEKQFDLNVIDIDSGIREMTAEKLVKELTPICERAEQPPVVVIDYLQIMPPSINAKDNIKSGIDDTLKRLKDFQQATNTTFIIISSFNRLNYSQEVDFESFKESGGIEYTADVIFGLQYDMYDVDEKILKISFKKKKIIDRKKRATPRQMHLKCLKNRHGQLYDCYFNYYSKYDTFEPISKNLAHLTSTSFTDGNNEYDD